MMWFNVLKDDIDDVVEGESVESSEDKCCKEAKQKWILRSNLPYLDDSNRMMDRKSCDDLRKRFESIEHNLDESERSEQHKIEIRILEEWDACVVNENRISGSKLRHLT